MSGDSVLGPTRRAGGWVLALPGAGLLAALLVPFRTDEAPTYEAVLFLGLAVACALVGGLWPALAAALAGTLLLNYYFTAPLHTLAIADPGNIVTLVVFVTVSVAVSSVVDSAARRRDQATAARDEADTLAMLNRTMLGGEHDVDGLLDLVRTTFSATEARLVPSTEAVAPGETVASAGHGTTLVLRGRDLTASDRRILHAFATHLAVLREREALEQQARAARELEATNRTRTALLAAVSHDLRTPLTGIRTAAEAMRLGADRISDTDRGVLLEAIEESTARLTGIVTDLLDMSRLQAGALELVLEPVSLSGLAVRALEGIAGADRVRFDEDLPDVLADRGFLERVLANLVANALRHADHVSITAEHLGTRVRVRVVDDGPGVPVAERARMFEPFQRLGDTGGQDGVGLGLAVARGLTEAQGGTLTASETPGGGLTMTVDLPGVSA